MCPLPRAVLPYISGLNAKQVTMLTVPVLGLRFSVVVKVVTHPNARIDS